ncbi:MAG: DUF1501 domain-containing protein [Imperialibacter sp.]
MRRRNFIRKLGFAAGMPIAFQGVPIKLLASYEPLQRLAAQSDNDKVLIILQMNGGNDGLNTFIPIEQYDQYYSRRANIAIPNKVGNRTLIPLDSTLLSPDQVGLHPDMLDFKYMYDVGKAAMFQGVSYKNNNGSHFRGTDIWMMGGTSDDYFNSGWAGRYLTSLYAPQKYPEDFPNTAMPDPLALEMGNDVSLLFHQDGNIPTSIGLGGSPTGLANLVDQLSGFEDQGIDPRGIPPEFLRTSPYGKEMDWILSLEDKSETYIKRLLQIYESASATSVTYPERYPFNAPGGSKRNPLSGQFQLIARLLGGGLKTKVFLVKIGGFDSHANQVEDYDSTMGVHGALLYHITSAIRAFQRDLLSRGIEDKVLTVTLSEFGRRIGSNGSYGTDHGTGGPVMMFGSGVKPGVYGTNPDLTKSNVEMQHDFRQIYANILHEWMGVDKSVVANDIFFEDLIEGPKETGGNYEPMDLIKDVILGTQQNLSVNFKIESVYPNPASDVVNLKVKVNDVQEAAFKLIDETGATVLAFTQRLVPGSQEIEVQLPKLPPGVYLIKVNSEKLNDAKRLIIN